MKTPSRTRAELPNNGRCMIAVNRLEAFAAACKSNLIFSSAGYTMLRVASSWTARRSMSLTLLRHGFEIMNARTSVFICLALAVWFTAVGAQPHKTEYEPSAQPTTAMQYFTPVEENYFAGDPMPFYHDGVFHVYWLLDYDHHRATEFGGHNWAHFSSTDLTNWTHHPLALTITESFEKSLCTGSVVYHDGKYYAFYPTRTDIDNDHVREEYISVAQSDDGISFTKLAPNKLLTPPPGFARSEFRDPHVFWDEDTRLFYMLVTTAFTEYVFIQNQTCLVYYTSTDLRNWQFKGPFYVPGYAEGYPFPECADCFKWNGRYYLLFKTDGGTYYRVADKVLGPWRTPLEDNIGSDYALVFKTAAFKGDRRIAVGMVPSRTDNLDDGTWQYAGNLVFRELLQDTDGSLRAVFPPEMLPKCGRQVELVLENPQPSELIHSGTSLEIRSIEGFAAARYANIPVNARITFQVEPVTDYTSLGCFLRDSTKGNYDLSFSAKANKVRLGNNAIEAVPGLNKPFSVDIVMTNSIIDICIAAKRCLLNRCPQQNGTNLVFYCHNGTARFSNINVRPISD